MELDRARLLTSPAGRAAVEEADPSLALLAPHLLVERLRRSYPVELAAAVAEQLVLRSACQQRLGQLPLALFSREGLEVMTHPAVAARRAHRLAQLGLPHLDLTCGLGGDLAAVAATGLTAYGIEEDGAIALLAAANVPAAGIVRGRAQQPPFALGPMSILIDPARRTTSGRTFDPDRFSPTFDEAIQLMRSARAGVMKTAPGIDHARLPAEAEVEFVQYERTLQEAAIWMGSDAIPGRRRAVLLPGGESLTDADPECVTVDPSVPGFLFDPESCVTRAGLVRQLAYSLRARRLDSKLAYLGAAAPAFDPLAATFEVLDRVQFSVARVRDLLRERRWRPDEIRRRAFPVEPDGLRRLLGRMEGEPVTLICTTVADQRTVFVCRRLFPSRNP